MNLLVVEDDETIAMGLEYSFTQEGYHVLLAKGVKEAEKIWQEGNIDVCILDLSLPDGTGYEICQKIKKDSDIPVLFLTACDDEVNVVMGLDMGADDYVTKPFRIRELSSRIKSILRRYKKEDGAGEEKIVIKNLEIYIKEGKVKKNGKEIPLTALEYRLLLVFAANRGQILKRNQLLEEIWDVSGDFVNDNTLTVYMKRLREKLEDNPAEPVLLQTVRGLGYRMEK